MIRHRRWQQCPSIRVTVHRTCSTGEHQIVSKKRYNLVQVTFLLTTDTVRDDGIGS